MTVSPPDQSQTAAAPRFLFVDSRLPDYQLIVAAAEPGTIVTVLDPTIDGLMQIGEALAGYSNVASIGVVSHGDDGVVVLGGTVLDNSDMTAYQSQLASIGACLAPGGDIQLFGCDVGAGSTGQAFVQALSAATGAVVAASTNQTGAADMGGDWNLEIATGDLSGTPLLDTAALTGWEHLAATQSVSTLAQLKTAIATDVANAADDTITLTSDITFTAAADTIGIAISDSHTITIVGGSHTISGANLGQVLRIASGGAVVIQNITITNGLATGTGGSNDTGTVGGAGTGGLGGGIFNNGNLSITGSTITGNKAAGGGGAGGSFSNSGGGGGGGGFGSGVGGIGGTGRYAASPSAPTAGHGGNGGGTSGGQRGGFGGSTAGGAGGDGLGSQGYTNGGAGGTANNGTIAIGGGGGGSGGYYPGGDGGAAVGGIYNTGTLSIATSSISNNIGAGGGGGGGGAQNYSSSGKGGNGGRGVGGIWNNGGVLNFDASTFASLSIGNTGGGGAGGIANGTGNTSGTTGLGSANVLCFCRGTLIMTPTGEVGAETLQAGDLVLTAHNGPREVVWVGKGKVLATRGRRSAATPVIVRKGALADNVPVRDLRITKAHSLYVGDVLVPVEFLVNHRTILWDDHAQEVELFHIELASHDVLIANGAPAESYRDDGNRWLFQNANEGWGLPPREPYAPVLTGGPVVDAIWAKLLERAGPRNLPPMTDDADLHLIADGKRIDSIEGDGMLRMFRLPDRPKDVRLVSRDVVPSEIGFARDTRSLGVAVQRVVIRQRQKFEVIYARDSRLANGFHDYEAEENLRWTTGQAELPPDIFSAFQGPMDVIVMLGATTQYPVPANSRPRVRRRA